MKRLRILSIFMVLFTAMGSFVSCETEPVDPLLLIDDSDEGPIDQPAVFQVDFGGQTFIADRTEASIGDGFIVITGYKGTLGENVTITVPATTPGTYSITSIVYDPGENPNFYTNINPAGMPTGSVTIYEIDAFSRTLTGVFSFTGFYSLPAENLPSIAFTNGAFSNIRYNAPTTPPVAGPGVFSVDIDGVAFVADNTEAILGSGLLSIGGFKLNGESVGISLAETTPGTYTEVIFGYSTDEDTDENYSNLLNTTGTITIIEVDVVNRTISGTFSFTGDYSDTSAGLPSKVFTNGVFTDIPYSEEASDPDVFNATVDGTPIEYGGSDLIVVTASADDEENETVSINALNANHRIDMFIDADLVTGTHVFTNSLNSTPRVVYTDTVNNITYTNITGGLLTVTTNDGGRMVGTFNFTVKDDAGVVVLEVTSGAFDIEYDF